MRGLPRFSVNRVDAFLKNHGLPRWAVTPSVIGPFNSTMRVFTYFGIPRAVGELSGVRPKFREKKHKELLNALLRG